MNLATAPVLYLSYNGINEPLVHSQVLNYLRGLAGLGHRFVLVTFERPLPAAGVAAAKRAELAALGIDWHALPAHAGLGPISSTIDVLRGYRLARRLCRGKGITLVHARSFIPAVIGRRLKRSLGLRLLNDIRGFWVDEKVYKGSLRAGGLVFRLAKRLEGWVLRGSDAIVSLSDAGQVALRDFPCFRDRAPPPMVTIRTCADLSGAPERAPRQAGPPVFGYVGSMSADYLPDQVFRWFRAAARRFPGARLHLVSRSEPSRVLALAASHGVEPGQMQLRAVGPADVPAEIAGFDLALSLIRPGFAKIASCPTKVGEYLACGVPVLSNRGIGDIDAMLVADRSGVVLEGFADAELEASLDAVEILLRDPERAGRCRLAAERGFSLRDGIRAYAELYRQLLENKD